MIAIWSRGFQAIGRLPFGLALWLFPVLVFLHNPQRLILPELWGEDGPLWYAQAYQFGLQSLLIPAGSYLNSVQRLVAIAVQPLPLSWTPFLFQLASILIQAAPAIFLVSRRMDAVWPDRASRCLFALLYLLMPNAPETAAGLTNSQWYLAILAFLIVVSAPPANWPGRLLETAVLIVAGFSGPFCFTILPAAIWELFAADRANRADAWRRLIALVATCIGQGLLILALADQSRGTGTLGANADLFIRILGMISLGAQLGYRRVVELSASGWLHQSSLVYLSAVGSMVLVAAAVAGGSRIFIQFLIFAAGVFVLALARPLISLTEAQWPMILTPPAGNRYFLFPMLAWWGALFVLAAQPPGVLRIVARALVVMTVVFAIPRDWGATLSFPPTDFIARAHEFEKAPPGTVMEFAIWPNWTFSLTK